MDALTEIKRLYLNASPATIARDIDAAVGLLKTMATDAERERAAVYMDGLSQMRSEWHAEPKPVAARLRPATERIRKAR